MSYCVKHNVISVPCVYLSGCSDGDVRLVGGSTFLQGRVEFCYNDDWGTVCDDSWGTMDASVVCRQLGFSSEGAIAFSNAFFGQGSGPILLDDVRCVGTESRLIYCLANSIGSHNCAHSEDAGVRCISGMFFSWGCFKMIQRHHKWPMAFVWQWSK